MHVAHLSLRGLPPWGHTTAIGAGPRAVLLAATGLFAALAAAWIALRRLGIGRGRLHAILVGASGPLAALGALRLLERQDARPAAFAAVPLAAALGVALVGAILARLLRESPAATK